MIISFVNIICYLSLLWPQVRPQAQEWGFYGHRKINFMAVFTLPEEMLPLFKTQILYLSEHAVDADKRRYAAKEEAIRHYIDLDHYPSDRTARPKLWVTAKEAFTKVTINYQDSSAYSQNIEALKSHSPDYYQSLKAGLSGHLYDFEWSETFFDSINNTTVQFHLQDTLIQHGVVPYQVPLLYRRLVKAMADHDIGMTLRLSADMGHYLADAHVPLHTTSNYDGQLTDQTGLHAFWESRIPELFADKEYDFLVGKAEYIEDVATYIWKVVDDSYMLVDSVLRIEKRISTQFPADQQYCFVDRLQQTVRVPCPDYAALYQRTMKGMVEKRMQEAILAVGSIWYSAWVDAGQPELHLKNWTGWTPEALVERDSLDQAFKSGNHLGRPHPDHQQ